MRRGLLRRGMTGLAALCLSYAIIVTATAALAGEVVFPRGAVVGLAPPPGMVESTTFSGFEDRAHNASILIVDMPPEAYGQLEGGFSDAALAAKGITVESRGPFAISGAKGYLVTGTQTAGPFRVRKWVLLAGTDLVTALVTVQVAETDAATLPDAEVRAALASLAFRSPESQVAALPFTLTDLAGFRVVRTFGGSTVMLTDGPKNVIEGAEQPYFVVSVAVGAPREDERRQFALRALSTLSGLKDMRLERAEPLRISQVPGFEVMAQAVDAKTGEPVKIIQWLRFGQTGHMRMVGISKVDAFPELYPRFRAIRDGVDAR
ncbi:hypothetical protein [Xanthobacter agilis]|uniref:Uncharacterized protein n=1 Tax=Xanthobacter agilis TaxID=47492 RepID=A0ABU0LDM6_XANAG|nr:hypothetical protein [Xanthobacter agilis]MDQ0505202.1 hypothetical protein [Xanthobacter agilis]